MADLQILQMGEPFIGGGDVPQMLFGVNQHQARSVDAEHRVSGAHDLMDASSMFISPKRSSPSCSNA